MEDKHHPPRLYIPCQSAHQFCIVDGARTICSGFALEQELDARQMLWRQRLAKARKVRKLFLRVGPNRTLLGGRATELPQPLRLRC